MTTSYRTFINRSNLLTVALLLAIITVVISSSAVRALVDVGDIVSRKVTGISSDAALTIGVSVSGKSIVGTEPVVATTGTGSSSVSNTVTHVDLTGRIQSLNSLPAAEYWFVWGYDASALTNTTTVSTTTTTGTKTVSITALTGEKVYYQFVVKTDGTAYGSIQSFISGETQGLSYWLLRTLLPTIIAGSLLVGVLWLSGNLLAAVLAALTGVIGYAVITAALNII